MSTRLNIAAIISAVRPSEEARLLPASTLDQRLDHRQVALEGGTGNRQLVLVVRDQWIGLELQEHFPTASAWPW